MRIDGNRIRPSGAARTEIRAMPPTATGTTANQANVVVVSGSRAGAEGPSAAAARRWIPPTSHRQPS